MKITVKKGLDLPIKGAVDASKLNPVDVRAASVAVVPDDFPGFTPKVDVKPGDRVAAGAPLMHQKEDARLRLVSPVAGVVTAVERGERRKVLYVQVTPDGSVPAQAPLATAPYKSAADAIDALAASGLLALMRTRPYDIVPDPARLPRDIFVTAFDSAPLAVTAPAADVKFYNAAVAMLSLLTKGKVYVSRRLGQDFPDIEGAEMVDVAGPHPSGLVGTQIAAVKPVNKGQVVWTLTADTLYRIGTLALTGAVDWSTLVAVTGSEVSDPYIARTVCGVDMAALLKGHVKETPEHKRIISGNVLTGVKVGADGWLRFPYTQVTVIPEGDDVDEFMGWASLSPRRMSVSPTYPGSWFKKLFNPDARVKGGRRAIIMSGEYDRYMPMDIMAEYLIKAIQSNDIDQMEKLGIYEVAPEDFALAEYADSSKLPLQSIVRHGLDYLRREVE